MAEKAAAREKRLVPHIWKHFVTNWQQDSSICGRNVVVIIRTDTLTRTLNRPRMTLFDMFVGEENEIKPAPSMHSPAQNGKPARPKCASSSGTQHGSYLRANAAIA